MQTVASATEQLSASIGEIGRQTGQSAVIAGKAVADTLQTDQVVQSLAASAQRIGTVVSLIQDIAAIQTATGEAVSAISGIARTIGALNEIATAIAAAVQEQGAATHEIAHSVQKAAEGTQAVSGNVSGVLQAAANTDDGARQGLEAAAEMSQQAVTLNTLVNRYIVGVQSA